MSDLSSFWLLNNKAKQPELVTQARHLLSLSNTNVVPKPDGPFLNFGASKFVARRFGTT